ncbi:cytochrome P450 [Lophiostoma macrostomum CBS 122681]|uniref:Bifunctional cytochrome P450/NADPH--P450 reductase n=1 Tax=Lophiostoma macrostomum CBS 122681 TaxID=1314788 RepID=A0A6A6SY59_9PLEO|nr:cytochrome P450 [Lophiostoma macrostomum CBS 122681]
MASEQVSLPIPQPPTRFLFGNLGDIDPENMPASMWKLADIYGPIFKLDVANRTMLVCSDYELVNDLCDSDRFEKKVDGVLKEVRFLTKDGLFTAYPGEPNWGVAHRILVPVFGPRGIQKYMDIASQMILRWDRFGDREIVCSDDFTRLAFDVIGLCAFGYRFNNFYSPDAHPFVKQMGDVLTESGKRASRLQLENTLRVFSASQNQENVRAMHQLCDEIIAERQAHPQPDSNDLLNAMLEGRDPQTGEKLSAENIRYNLVTFLVAGHETTSGSLSFLFFHLLKNPETYMKAQKEVDDVVGDKPIEYKHLSKFVYIKYAIFEALRYMGPIAFIAKHAKKPTKLAGKYDIDPADQILCNLRPFHHDPKVWGDDADVFRPERFLNGGWESLPKNAFKAFGDGERACIGRGFTEQEMILTVALILQKFQVEMADPSYSLHVHVTLTLKPEDFRIKVRRRPGRDPAQYGAVVAPSQAPSNKDRISASAQQQDLKPLTVLYGSQSGTCKSYAEEIESNAPRFGFKATVQNLDSATEDIAKNQPIAIICPSYEGKPADNAKKFVTWLETTPSSTLLDGVQYCVFGVGNSDWVTTFHKVPKLIDEQFEKKGAKRITGTGFVDVKFDIMGPWEDWLETVWDRLRKTSGTTTEILAGDLKAEITVPKFATHLGGPDISYGTVTVNKDLADGEVGLAKKHIEIELPFEIGYRSGDYLAFLPLNRMDVVMRVVKRFDIQPDDSITITGTNKAFLLPNEPTSVFDLLMTRVELNTPVSQKQIQVLSEHTPESKRPKLLEFAKDDVYKTTVVPKRYSLLDLLEENPDTVLPFATYLDMLKPLTPRQYSISSSPLASVDFVQTADGKSGQKLTASVTYDVHDEPAWSGHGQFRGVASTYLARQEPGDKVRCFTRPTNVNFHLPLDPTTPIIMIAAGSGIAPMRGFLQERATIKAARNAQLGPALLYFGCRHHEKDFIYKSELQKWEDEGVVSVRPCFSKVGPEGCFNYVPDRMWAEREELADLFRHKGAKIFVCGSASKLAKSTAGVCKKIYMKKSEKGEEEAEAWLDRVKEDRYVSDVFE